MRANEPPGRWKAGWNRPEIAEGLGVRRATVWRNDAEDEETITPTEEYINRITPPQPGSPDKGPMVGISAGPRSTLLPIPNVCSPISRFFI